MTVAGDELPSYARTVLAMVLARRSVDVRKAVNVAGGGDRGIALLQSLLVGGLLEHEVRCGLWCKPGRIRVCRMCLVRLTPEGAARAALIP